MLSNPSSTSFMGWEIVDLDGTQHKKSEAIS
jgi:hypothetical protein